MHANRTGNQSRVKNEPFVLRLPKGEHVCQSRNGRSTTAARARRIRSILSCIRNLGLLSLLLLLLMQNAQAAEKETPASSVAVLDLASPDSAPWLGAAIAESLAARLGGVEKLRLVERENIHLLLQAASANEIKPALLGADFVVTGSVQLNGAWTDEFASIRISVKLVASESAKIHGDAALIKDGKLTNLFALETELAESLAKAMGKEPTVSAMAYCEERSLRSRQLFGEGLSLLRKAAALPGTDALFRERDVLAMSAADKSSAKASCPAP